ncbi:MAG: hypothetical protein EB060_05405 [Proteobacteria bacterium]|nr:hypothetical protein [Pseudomonadota bacterium]
MASGKRQDGVREREAREAYERLMANAVEVKDGPGRVQSAYNVVVGFMSKNTVVGVIVGATVGYVAEEFMGMKPEHAMSLAGAFLGGSIAGLAAGGAHQEKQK